MWSWAVEEKSLETVMSFLKRIEKAVDRSDLSIESIEAASAAWTLNKGHWSVSKGKAILEIRWGTSGII